MKLALQLYSVRQHFGELGIPEVLRRVREMGYTGAEWFDLLGMTPEELAQVTEEAGLSMFSLHISIHHLLSPDEDFLRRLGAVGVKYLPIGWLPTERLAGGELFRETCGLIRQYAALAGKYGLTVLYHNHDFDLEPITAADGSAATKLDVLYGALPEALGGEPDTCWLYTGGVDPAAFIAKYSDRCPIIHLKDCVAEGGRTGFKPVGSGVLDFAGILEVSGKAEWVCVEQDDPSDGMDAFACAAASAEYCRRLL